MELFGVTSSSPFPSVVSFEIILSSHAPSSPTFFTSECSSSSFRCFCLDFFSLELFGVTPSSPFPSVVSFEIILSSHALSSPTFSTRECSWSSFRRFCLDFFSVELFGVTSSSPFPSVVFFEIILSSHAPSSPTFSTRECSCSSFRRFCLDIFSVGFCGVTSSSPFPSVVSFEIILSSHALSSPTFSNSECSFSSFRCFCSDLFSVELFGVTPSSPFPSVVSFEIILSSHALSSPTFSTSECSFSSFRCFCSDLFSVGICGVNSSSTSPSVVFSEIIVISPTVSSLTFSTSVSTLFCSFRCFCLDRFSVGLCGVESSSTFPSVDFFEIILPSPTIS